MYSGTMYSGTLIQDLVAMVERTELFSEMRAQQRRIAEEADLRRLFAMQSPQQAERVYAGAA
jgi:hypothetical protein